MIEFEFIKLHIDEVNEILSSSIVTKNSLLHAQSKLAKCFILLMKIEIENYTDLSINNISDFKKILASLISKEELSDYLYTIIDINKNIQKIESCTTEDEFSQRAANFISMTRRILEIAKVDFQRVYPQ